MPMSWVTPKTVEVDVDLATRWWRDYPIKQYNRLSRAQDLHKELVTETFHKPRALARSVSAMRFAECPYIQHDFPIQRSPSVSLLSPSHAQAPLDRQAHRYIPSYTAYEPRSQSNYYHQTYSPYKTRDLISEVSKVPSAGRYQFRPEQKYYPLYRDRIRSAFWDKIYCPPSYFDVAAARLATHVGSKIRSVGYQVPFIYTTYDQGPLYVAPFDRHVRSGLVLHSRLGPPPAYVRMTNHRQRTLYHSVAPKYAYKPTLGRMAAHRW